MDNEEIIYDLKDKIAELEQWRAEHITATAKELQDAKAEVKMMRTVADNQAAALHAFGVMDRAFRIIENMQASE